MIRMCRLLINDLQAFSVLFMDWNTFIKQLLKLPEEWHIFRDADCIIGGADMSINYV